MGLQRQDQERSYNFYLGLLEGLLWRRHIRHYVRAWQCYPRTAVLRKPHADTVTNSTAVTTHPCLLEPKPTSYLTVITAESKWEHLSFAQILDPGCFRSLSISSNLSTHMRPCWCHCFILWNADVHPSDISVITCYQGSVCPGSNQIPVPSHSLHHFSLFNDQCHEYAHVFGHACVPVPVTLFLSFWSYCHIAYSSLKTDYVWLQDLKCSGQSLAQKSMDIYHFYSMSTQQPFSTYMDHP